MPIEHELKETLLMPVEFSLRQGLVHEVRFTESEQPWSANIKRAILNMLQANTEVHLLSLLHTNVDNNCRRSTRRS